MNNQTHKSDRASDRGHAVIALSPPAFAVRLRGCGGGEATPLEPRGAAAPRASVVHRLPSVLGTSRILAALCVCLTCVGAPLLFAQQTNCTPRPPGMVAWWPGDGFALDVVGTNHGTLQNGATYGPGKAGQAFSFNGLNSAVDAGAGPDLVLTNDFSIEAWIFPTGPGTAQNGGIIVNKEGEYEIARYPDGSIQWALANTTPGWVYINTGLTAPLNQWTHLALSYSNGIVRTYL